MEVVRLKLLWSNLFGLRFMLTILPQNGFIYKEEFTKSPEMMADILLRLKPENSSVFTPHLGLFPFLSSGIPYLILKAINEAGFLGYLITPYIILVAPRIWSTFVSLLCDVCVYKLAINSGCNMKEACTAMMLHAGSYVVWVFFTRTFSSGIETIIFAIMLNVVTRKQKSETEENDVKEENTEKSRNDNCFREAFHLCCLLLLGMNINSHFIHFGLFPLICWASKQITVQSGTIFTKVKLVFYQVSTLTLAWFLISAVAIACNILCSEPHSFNTMSDIVSLKLLSLPLNFLNVSKSLELEQFGNIHWKIIRVCVTVLAFYAPLLIMVVRSKTAQRNNKIIVFSVMFGVVNCVIFKSAPFMSCIPLIIPLVVMAARCTKTGKPLIVFWCVFNFMCFMYYGVFLQGGALQSMEYLNTLAGIHTNVGQNERDLNITAVFHKTSPPPAYLAAWKRSDGTSPGSPWASLNILDMSTAEDDTLRKKIDELLLSDPETTVFLIVPSSLSCASTIRLHMLYDMELYYQFFPHLDFKLFPDLGNREEWCTSQGSHHHDEFNLLVDKLSLNIFKVSRPRQEQSTVENKVEEVKVLLHNYASTT